MFKRFYRISVCIFIFLSVPLFLISCKEDAVTVYRVPKEAPKEVAGAKEPKGGMSVLPGMAETAAQFETPEWIAPADWQPQPLGQMRKGSWQVTGVSGQTADVSVLVFPGDVGGVLANVNRWRQQVGLDLVTEENLGTVQVSIGDRPGQLIALQGPSQEGQTYPQGILGCIVNVEGNTWFFKMAGDGPLVAEQQQAFNDFLQTVRMP